MLGQHLRLPQLARSVDTRKPALANAMLDQPYDALATRAFERVDLVVSGDGLDCDGNAFHAACEAALLRFAVEFTSILHQRIGHGQLLFLLELDIAFLGDGRLLDGIHLSLHLRQLGSRLLVAPD